MADFNDDTKKELGKYFSEGVHKVKITGIALDETQDGKEFFEFGLEGENKEEGIAKVYWTEKAAPYSFNTVRDIFVHNTVEKNKQAIRDKVDATKNTDELLKLVQDNLEGKECWYKVEKTDQTYVDSRTGETKNSYNRNIYGYEPKMTVKKDHDTILEDIKAGEPLDLSEVPFE